MKVVRAFFNSQARVRLLDLSADRWVGTPFRDNSMVCRQGANCVSACAGLLRDAGLRFPEFPRGVPTNWARYQTESAMEKWLDGQAEYFGALPSEGPALDELLEAGDVVGFRAGLCIHHLGIILSGGRFFQCNESLGAAILSRAEPMFRKRLARGWRPLMTEELV